MTHSKMNTYMTNKTKIEAIKARYMDAAKRFREASRDLRQATAQLEDECSSLSESMYHRDMWADEARGTPSVDEY